MSVEFTVLDETEFTDRSDPSKPVDKLLVTYQTVEGRVATVAVLRAGYTKEVRNKAVAAAIKASPPKTFERVKM